MVGVVVVIPVRFRSRLAVAFVEVLVVLVTNAVMLFPIISRRTIPGGPRRVVVTPSLVRAVCAVVVMCELVDTMVRGGIVLLNPELRGVELRMVTGVEGGRTDELLGRMLELGVGVAELETGLGVVVVVVGILKHSVTVLVTVSNGQLVTVTVANGTKQLLNVTVAVLVMVMGGWVVTLEGQAAQSAVAISQMAVDGGGPSKTARGSSPALSSR